jgi:hypothetical protein
MIQEAYNREAFLRFLRTFLPDDYVQNVVQRTNPAHKFTQSVMELGKCASLDLMVFEIHHSSSNDARVGIAQETFRLMNSLACRRALIVFIPENSDQWRFSLLEITLEWDEKKINRTFSNPRRHSYLLGKNAHTKTPEHFIIKKGPIRARREGNKDLTPWEDLQSRFSVEALTKEFYNQLYNWYLWAIDEETKVTFPNSVDTSEDDRDNIRIKIIRLITRLLFVWFIKQKGLVPDVLFDENELTKILANFDPQADKDGKYYNAILQNLFFATLNNEINKRRFMSEPYHGVSDSYGVKTLFRDNKKASWFNITHEEVLQLFHNIPFMNCGLFECLDKYAKSDIGHEKDTFLDGFSSRGQDGNLKYRAFIPNWLFFAPEGTEVTVTIQEDGEIKRKTIDVIGLVPLLKLYNFTVQENTPAEVEVSLDPELLGRVFENLLAAYNPETKDQASDRKSTGSFYTPRPIVEYMVNESLIAYLKTKVPSVEEDTWRALISYEDKHFELTEDQRTATLNALYECKILDPACGSGAFPMGMLQQMVHITRKLDSEFDPYQTKLRIINNCIYGSDIQPIAMLISKLRFFISLICEQDESRINYSDPDNNYGIDTLPNLETKFVAANSLLRADIRNYADDDWTQDATLIKLKNDLLAIRKSHFSVRTQTTKLKKREEDRLKREEIQNYILQSTTQPDPVKIQMYEARINHLNAERVLYEGEKIVEEIVDTQANLFDEAQPQVVRKDINKIHRDRIDAEIKGLQQAIAKEQNKRNPVGFNAAIKQITDWNPYDQLKAAPFFDPDWMFGITDGFDIVIGNPPYRIVPKEDPCKVLYDALYEVAQGGKRNLYHLFFELGIKLLKKKGALSYITPDTYFSGNDTEALRKLFVYNTDIVNIIHYTEKDKVFENVTQAVAVIVMLRQPHRVEFPIITGNTIDVIQYSSLCPDNKFVFKGSNPIVDKMKKAAYKIGDVCDGYKGDVNLGLKKDYFTFKNEKGTLPLIRGVQIGKYTFSGNTEYCYKIALSRNDTALRRIVFQEVANMGLEYRIKATILQNVICGDSTNYVYSVKSDLSNECLLGIINSKAVNYYFKYFNQTNHVPIGEFKNIPFPSVGIIVKKRINDIVKNILQLKESDINHNTSDLESQIDILVYLLYKLTYDEVRIIDPNIETIISEAEYNKRLAENV